MTDKQLQMIESLPVYIGQEDSYVMGTAELFRWSENYDYPTPASLYLDLIGYSAEHIGQPLFDLSQVHTKIGYLEIGQLGDALNEYAANPQDVTTWVERFMDAQTDDDTEDES